VLENCDLGGDIAGGEVAHEAWDQVRLCSTDSHELSDVGGDEVSRSDHRMYMYI